MAHLRSFIKSDFQGNFNKNRVCQSHSDKYMSFLVFDSENELVSNKKDQIWSHLYPLVRSKCERNKFIRNENGYVREMRKSVAIESQRKFIKTERIHRLMNWNAFTGEVLQSRWMSMIDKSFIPIYVYVNHAV